MRVKIEIVIDLDNKARIDEALIMLSDSVGYLGDLKGIKHSYIQPPAKDRCDWCGGEVGNCVCFMK